MREYKECYIAVLDLLGFRNALTTYDCETIASFFDEIEQDYVISFTKTGEPIIRKEDINIKIMSDTICIFVDVSVKNALTALIATCDYLQIRLLRLPIPILSRGAIVKGEIYHNNDVLFGQGFVKAYYMQEKETVYPRVIIDRGIIDSYKPCDELGQSYLKNIIKDVYDDKYISDYLFIFYGLNHDQESWKQFAKYITENIENTSEDVKPKYTYLRDNILRVTKKYFEEYKN